MWQECKDLQDYIVNIRRELHQIPELGFELPKTQACICKALDEMGVPYKKNQGDSGIIGEIQGGHPGKTILLRADIDALPIHEDTGLPFTSKHEGKMHACGHDMHTSVLLGAAMLLKRRESQLKNRFKLLFQPAEETLEGAEDVIKSGVLENPEVDYAVMLHCLVGIELPAGTIVISSPGVSAPGADHFKIRLSGKGCHGSMPEKGKDPLAVACKIITALDEIRAKELSISDRAVLTVGMLNAGNTGNVIPDTAEFAGTLRAYSESSRALMKKRLKEISAGIAKTFGVSCETVFEYSCPSLLNDADLSEKIFPLRQDPAPRRRLRRRGRRYRNPLRHTFPLGFPPVLGTPSRLFFTSVSL